VDSDAFDDEINNLKNLINSMGSGDAPAAPISTGPSISTKELNRLKELTNKIPELEDMLNKILKDLKGLNLGELKDKLKELEKLINEKADKDTVDKALADLSKRVD
jgi:DNA-binding transcriptional MerR regulator